LNSRRVLAVAVKDVRGNTPRSVRGLLGVRVSDPPAHGVQVQFGGSHRLRADVGVVTYGSKIAEAFVEGLKGSKELHVRTLSDERGVLRLLKRATWTR